MPTNRPTSTQAQVIRRKITAPPLPDRLVARRRIERLVEELIDEHPTVWVVATAGSGKTTAVAQALAGTKRPVAWLTLDDTDTAAGRLLTYLEAALGAEVSPGPGCRDPGPGSAAAPPRGGRTPGGGNGWRARVTRDR